MKIKYGYTLRFIIGLLAISSVVLTAVINGLSALQVNRDSLSLSYLEKNYQYAKKLSDNTETLLSSMEKNIEIIAKLNQQRPVTQEELHIFYEANKHYFNSLFIVDEQRYIHAISPTGVGTIIGTQLSSQASKQAVFLKKPFISEPYYAVTGRLIVLVSYPFFDKKGNYRGFVGGTIHLEKNNVLNRMLKDNSQEDGSYVYVVDQKGNIIFHPDKTRIHDLVIRNEVGKKALAGKSGSQMVTNTKGKEYFAGYAFEQPNHWGIISQTPTSIIIKPTTDLVVHMIERSFPFVLFILLLAWLVSYRIGKPLYKLAKFTENASENVGESPTSLPEIHSMIYEVNQLYQITKQATLNVNEHVDKLKTEGKTDGLTGLLNRKSFDIVIEEWIGNQIPFSLILFDIDHFKKINDEYGHLGGDEVLKFLANTLRVILREEDLSFRYGGEEFCILTPHSEQEVAIQIAERLREKLRTIHNPIGREITISVGIAMYPQHANNARELIKNADISLYQSKEQGRDGITIYTKK